MLRVSGLSKRFGTIQAVDNVSFEIERGCAFGLLGPNGAGKTTTISMIVGALDPDAGTVELDGKPIGPEAKHRLGFVPQELALYEEISALDNLRFFSALYQRSEPAKIAEVLELVGLADRAKEPVRTFSGGMKRRLNMAVGLVHKPDLLVLDEPTVGVDPQSRNAIFDTLETLRKDGVALLYTTHYMNEVERLCDRVAIMDHGSVIAEDSIDELHHLMPARERVTFDLDVDPPPFDIPGAILDGRKLHFDLEDLDLELPATLRSLQSAGISYRSVRSHRASLEEDLPTPNREEPAGLMLGTLFQMVLKDLKLFASDRRALIISFLVPTAIASFMGMLTDNLSNIEKPKPIALLLVDNDHSDISAKLDRNLHNSPSLKAIDFPEDKARAAVKSGDYGLAVVVPKGFGTAASNGGRPDLELVTDPSQALQAETVRGALIQATTGAIYGGDSGHVDMPFTLKQTSETSASNPRWSGTSHAFAGMGVQGLLFWAIELAMGLMRERGRGLWRRMRSAPPPIWMHVVARAISASLRAMLILMCVFCFGALAFHVRIDGSWLGFGMIWICASVMAATFGLFVASLGKTEQQSRGLAVLVVLTMTMLGGAWFPSFLMPQWIQAASNFIPVKHAVDGFDSMTWRAQPWQVAITPALALLGFTAVFLAVALVRFGRQVEPAGS